MQCKKRNYYKLLRSCTGLLPLAKNVLVSAFLPYRMDKEMEWHVKLILLHRLAMKVFVIKTLC